jgi:hypothetical protein
MLYQWCRSKTARGSDVGPTVFDCLVMGQLCTVSMRHVHVATSVPHIGCYIGKLGWAWRVFTLR